MAWVPTLVEGLETAGRAALWLGEQALTNQPLQGVTATAAATEEVIDQVPKMFSNGGTTRSGTRFRPNPQVGNQVRRINRVHAERQRMESRRVGREQNEASERETGLRT